jgi:hypothetical protein
MSTPGLYCNSAHRASQHREGCISNSTALPAPDGEPAEEIPMPAQDGVRLDSHERLFPMWQHSIVAIHFSDILVFHEGFLPLALKCVM